MWIIPKWLELNQFLFRKKQAILRKQPTFCNTNTSFAPKKITGEQAQKFHSDDASLLRFGQSSSDWLGKFSTNQKYLYPDLGNGTLSGIQTSGGITKCQPLRKTNENDTERGWKTWG